MGFFIPSNSIFTFSLARCFSPVNNSRFFSSRFTIIYLVSKSLHCVSTRFTHINNGTVVIWLPAQTHTIQFNIALVAVCTRFYRRCGNTIQKFVCRAKQIVFTVFNSHEIQMHTKVENRCTDPFLQWFKSSIGIDCVRASSFGFYPSSTLNMDNMYSYTLVFRVSWLCCLTLFCFEFMCIEGNSMEKENLGLLRSCAKYSPENISNTSISNGDHWI